jgi:hypothetical protein
LVYTLEQEVSNVSASLHATAHNPLWEKTWENWTAFYAGTSGGLNGHEYCDCHRADRGFSRANIVENRHYSWPGCNVTISYFQSFRMDENTTGHLTYPGFAPTKYRTVLSDLDFSRTGKQGLRCSRRLPDLVEHIGRSLRPTTIVYGTGLWTQRPWVGGAEFRHLRACIETAAPCVIWKTTTRLRKVAAAQLTAHAASAFANGPILDAARYTDSLQLTRTAENLYADDTHFTPSSGFYHDLNVALLAGLFSKELRAKPEL